MLGPTPEVERAALGSASIAVSIGAVSAMVAVAASAAIAGDRLVDTAGKARGWRWLPFEMAFVGLAVLSFRRLDRGGGLRMFGVESRGGELLAQAFPLLGVVAVVAALARPVRWVGGRLRLTGSRLHRGVRLGWRRVVIEPSLTAVLVSAVALASGCFALSTTLAASSREQLDEKARTFVGADLAITVFDDVEVPPALADRATFVIRYLGALDGKSFDVLGVDRSEFARDARLRPDASARSLEGLMAAIAPRAGEPLPAVLVNTDDPGATITLETSTGAPTLQLRAVASADFFPGYQNNRSFAIVAVTMQLLVVEARRDSRRLSHIVMRRTGFGTGSLWLACVVEVAVPLLTGVGVGYAGGIGAARLAVARLDPLPNLQPPARLVLSPRPALEALVVVGFAIGALATLAARSTLAGGKMAVIRATA